MLFIVDGVENGFVKIRDPWGNSAPGVGQRLEGKLKISYFKQVWRNGPYASVF